ncbi:MAG: putative pre-16S rRNA nuclease [Pirellulaceae bacterium]|nr:MAG: putative pre-16S rRNA nuclease [Pirellulaceae bacterium]
MPDGSPSHPTVDPQGIPYSGRLIGIDFGTVRMGLAVCDPSQQWVTPLETWQRSTPQKETAYFQQLVRSQRVAGWIIGLPIHCDGNESRKSTEARAFAGWLHELTRLPVAFQDERFSSKEARRLLFDTGLSGRSKKKRLDRIAAYVILSNYLETRQSGVANNAALED